MKVTLDLWEHQVKLHNDTVPYLKERGYCFWHAGCATGKTLTALRMMQSLHENRGAMKFLVLTTKPAMTDAWLSHLDKFVEGADYDVMSKGNSLQKAQRMLEHDVARPYVVVVNYATATAKYKGRYEFKEAIEQMGFDFAVADESHRLKTYNTATSLLLAEACADVPYKIAMTATGWKDSPLDIFGQARWLDPVLKRGNELHHSSVFGHYTKHFESRYSTFYMKDNIRITTGYINQEELGQVVNEFAIEIKTEDVRDLPPVRFLDRNVTLAGKTKKIYKQLLEDSYTLVDGKVVLADNPLVLAMRLHQVTTGYVTDEDGQLQRIPKENGKLKALLGIVEELGGEPFVVFTRFQHDVAILKTELEKQGLDVKQLTGKVHENEQFLAGDGDCIIANISAGSEGIDLSRARVAIYYSINSSNTQYEQSKWRIRRHEGNQHILYYRIITEGTIDRAIYNALEGKDDASDKLAEALTRSVT